MGVVIHKTKVGSPQIWSKFMVKMGLVQGHVFTKLNKHFTFTLLYKLN